MPWVMALNVNGMGLVPTRSAPAAPPPAELTTRDMAAATRAGVQAVPVRNIDPVTNAHRSARRGDTLSDKRAAEDADRLDMLRSMALRRDAASITAERRQHEDETPAV